MCLTTGARGEGFRTGLDDDAVDAFSAESAGVLLGGYHASLWFSLDYHSS